MIRFVPAVMLPRNIFTKTTVPKVSFFCKVCLNKFSPEESRFTKPYSLRCPYCNHILVPKKDRINSSAIRCLTRLICLRIPILCRANGSCLFISVRKPLHIFNHSKLMHNLFLDFEPEANTVTKSLILLALYSVVKQCYTVFADGKIQFVLEFLTVGTIF